MSACTILDSKQYPAGSGKIILSFDDGPSTEISHLLLDVLERTDTKAVFCYIGRNIEENPEIAARAIDAGHMVVLHSYEHTLESLLSANTLSDETQASIELIEKLPTRESAALTHFRPPLGIKTPAVQKVVKAFDLEYAYITLFVIDAGAGPKDADRVVGKIRKKVVENNGGAFVLHEMRYKAGSDKYAVDKSWLPKAVEGFINWAKSEGYEFTLYPQTSINE
ncbi:MAG: polysaccharide deacetylase family protein [Verrucomicrobiota bacterium]